MTSAERTERVDQSIRQSKWRAPISDPEVLNFLFDGKYDATVEISPL
jgi:hypothetical protein